jgi:hypothetical protein
VVVSTTIQCKESYGKTHGVALGSAEHVCDSSHHGAGEATRVLGRRRLSAVVVLWLLMLLLAAREQTRCQCANNFTSTSASLRIAVTAAMTSSGEASYQRADTSEGTRSVTVAVRSLTARELAHEGVGGKAL